MWRREWWAVAVSAVAATYFLLIWERGVGGVPAYDTYMYTLPNFIYAASRLSEGGAGLWWNAFQNCGQPFFGISSTGLLYPANVFFLALGGQQALYALIMFNLTVAGVSAYLLGRELGVSRAAALSGALAFELGNSTLDITTWTPFFGGTYAWAPAIMLCGERILRAPSAKHTIALALVVAVSMLPGAPQPLLFILQLLALRVAWAFASRQVARPVPTLFAFAVGLALPPLLTAVHFFPGLEMAQLSIRRPPLSLEEIRGQGFLGWRGFRDFLGMRREIINSLTFVPTVLAAASLARPRRRGVAVFYLVAAALAFALSFGPNTALFDYYLALPFSRVFREPHRLQWVTGFCLSVLTALGVDAIASRPRAATAWGRAVGLAVLPGLAIVAFFVAAPRGLFALEWLLACVVVLTGLIATVRPHADGVLGALLMGAAALGLGAFNLSFLPASITSWSIRPTPFRRPLPNADAVLLRHAERFARVRAIMTPQDRIYLAYPHAEFALMAKSGQLFGVPAVQDYEPQPSRRSAEYWTMMRTGVPMHDLNTYYYFLPDGPRMTSPIERRLLDLAAARYLIVDARVDATSALWPPLTLRFRPGPLEGAAPSAPGRGQPRFRTAKGVRVYENLSALPRARYVPRLEVVSDAQALLRRLARGHDDLTQVALVEAAPANGFLGLADNHAGGAVAFVTNDPEHVVLRVDAPARGFLHLADQYFPGWEVTVNGAPASITRANFIFRAVEVPAGQSTVEFRYRPRSLRLGALVSALSITGVLAWAVWQWHRRHSESEKG